MNLFESDPELGFFGGRILLYDPTDQPITIQTKTDREVIESGMFIEAGLIHGANFGFRREALVAAGGFDPFFGAGSYYAIEDIDGVARVSALGWKGIYDPGPLVYHHHGRKTLADVKVLENGYARGRGAYYVKCMTGKIWTRRAWKEWYWACRRKPFFGICKEFAGGLSFLFRSVWDRGRRFQRLDIS